MSIFYDAEHMLSTISVCTKKILFTMWPQKLRVSPDWRQVLLASALPAEASARWMRRFRSATASTYQIFLCFTTDPRVHREDARIQTPRWLTPGRRRLGSSLFIGRCVDVKDQMEDRVDLDALGAL